MYVKMDLTEKYKPRLKMVMKDCDMDSVAPKLKGLMKLRKASRPIHPPVKCIQSTSYKIARIATKFLKENFQFEPIRNMRYNLELIKKLGKVEIRNNDQLAAIQEAVL
jgi:hypothetical protein